MRRELITRWNPAPLFDVVDSRLSQHWIFGFSYSGVVSGTAVLAFPEWAQDPLGYYDRLTDGEESATALFARYREVLDLEFINTPLSEHAEDIGDGWLRCPRCFSSWRAGVRGETVRCQHCKAMLRNPATRAGPRTP